MSHVVWNVWSVVSSVSSVFLYQFSIWLTRVHLKLGVHTSRNVNVSRGRRGVGPGPRGRARARVAARALGARARARRPGRGPDSPRACTLFSAILFMAVIINTLKRLQTLHSL